MKKNTSKKNTLVLTGLAVAMAVSPVATSAATPEAQGVETKHAVPVVSIQTINGLVTPVQELSIHLDQNDKSFKSIRQQLEKESFGVLLTASNGKQVYLSGDNVQYADGVVTAKTNQELERYTAYTATILVKSAHQQSLKGNLPVGELENSNSVDFETGSAVGEAVEAELTLPSEIVAGEKVPVSGSVEDSYGNPVVGETVVVDGALDGTLTTDEDGNFEGEVEAVESGDVTVTVGGQPITVTTPNGTPLPEVTVIERALPASVTMVKPANAESGSYTYVSGKLLDEKGKTMGNKKIAFSGALSGFITTKADGSYTGYLVANASGTVKATVDGIVIPVTTSTGASFGTVTVTAGLARGTANTFGNLTVSNPYTSSGGKTVITGTLFGMDGRALPYTEVIMGINGYGGEYFRTDSKGNFSYTTYLYRDTYTFELWADTGYDSYYGLQQAYSSVTKYIR